MAKFNQSSGATPQQHAFRAQGLADRRKSLEAMGANIEKKMAELGCGERRAMAAIEKDLGLTWYAGGFGDQVRGHAKKAYDAKGNPLPETL